MKAWTEEQIAILRKFFPIRKTSEVAVLTGHSVISVRGKASALRILKSEEFNLSLASGRFVKDADCIGAEFWFTKGHTPINKGKKMPEDIKDQVKHTFFKKGHQPANTLHDGAESRRKDKNGHDYYYVRVAKMKWVMRYRLIWEKVNGPIPRGFVIRHKDGNTLNDDINNLELISRRDNMLLNSIQRYPEEIKSTIRVLSKLKKTIKDHEE